MKESFVLYNTQYEAIKDLSDLDLGKLIRALFEIQLGNEINLEPHLKIAFNFIMGQIQIDTKKYEEKCEKLRENAKKRQENKEKEESKSNQMLPNASKCNQMLANGGVNDNDNVNDNVNDLYINDNNSYKYSLLSPQSDNFIDSELVLELPLIDKSLYPIYEKDIQKWESIYPAVNIKQEFRNMLGWLDSHPKNRKTKSGVSRFINSWLGRCQDKARVAEVERDSTPTSTEKKINDPNDMSTWTDDYLLEYVNGGKA